MTAERANARVEWLVHGRRTGRPIVVSPDGGDTCDAAARVDAALDGFSAHVPSWYRGIERLGFWWYIVCLVVGVGISMALNPVETTWRIASGLTLGLILAPVTLVLLRGLARRQSRSAGVSSPAQALAEVAAAARPVNGEIAMQVSTVVAADPGQAPAVHRMAWRAAGADASARKDLEAAWAAAAPDAAADRAAKIARLQAEIDADKTGADGPGRG